MVLKDDRDCYPVKLLAQRELGYDTRKLQHRLQVTKPMIDRLGMEKELTGHLGCVNCLEWNSDGTILASASDDLRVILWDPFRYKQLCNIPTGHNGNIFSVKFLNPGTIATGAGDFTVRVREVASVNDPPLRVCYCHKNRVKRLATAPDCPQLFWTAAEDGLLLQHDMRSPHKCSSEPNNVLVNLVNYIGRYAEAKCVSVNPRRPELIAVGANDAYVRMYDRRMIRLSKAQPTQDNPDAQSFLLWEAAGSSRPMANPNDEANIPRDCVQYFAPGHLTTDPGEHTFPKKASTYVMFSDSGNELLVNLGSEQVYLYDINSTRRATLLDSFIIQHNHKHKNGVSESKGEHKNGTTSNGKVEASKDIWGSLPAEVVQIKDKANEYLTANNFWAAVEMYNTAIALYSKCALLYSNRAVALMRRGWPGDIYAAIRDCYTAISLDSQHVKSHFRLAKALMELKKPREAHECLMYFKEKFPKNVNSHAVVLLQKDINAALGNADRIALADEDTEEHTVASSVERHYRATAIDYTSRYIGHCNTTTDIKEAVFLGSDGRYIAAGSDDGNFFIWCRRTGNVIRCLHGDNSIVNCIQPHPSTFLIATSGIESVVRLWSPRPENGEEEPRLVAKAGDVAEANQRRMRSDPFEAMLLNISFASSTPDQTRELPACRPS